MLSVLTHFADRLAEAVRRCRTPAVVGLDPRLESLPAPLRGAADPSKPDDVARALGTFGRLIIDVVAPLVAAIKPQAAFFERVGPLGMQVLAEIIAYARHRGLLVILDGKRNDIGTTASAYAEGYLGPEPEGAWGADALTVSPYLGDDSLTPFFQVAQDRGAGVFVLVKTSNPGSGLFQDLLVGGRPLYEHVGQYVEQWAARTSGACGYGAVGGVVGATYPSQLAALRAAMPHTWFLVPGFGAQGATAKDVAGAFDSAGLGALVNNSRGIIFAHARKEYKDRYGDRRWQAAVEAATLDMIDQLAQHTSAGRLRPL